jgi:FAD/FMN-containing dehydrogenase
MSAAVRSRPHAPGVQPASPGIFVNDLHSRLNATRVRHIVRPASIDDLRAALAQARDAGDPVSIAGGWHAMGGQQFVSNGVLIDTRGLNRVIAFDRDRGLVTVEGGIHWPDVLAFLTRAQMDGRAAWAVAQMQTGAERLSVAGALSCNAHGRGLTLGPIVQQVESFDLMDHTGQVSTCSRTSDPARFSLAIGGYGLFGVITRVVLRLRPRMKLRRVVEIADMASIAERFDSRIRDGFQYGDFQFAIDHAGADFLRRGIFSCYAPVPAGTPVTPNPARFTPRDWAELIRYAHTHKRVAFELYAGRYLQSSGQISWSDAPMGAPYRDGYHADLDRALRCTVPGSEMITEVYVPRARLAGFMTEARAELIARRADVIYGTVRLIERDDETVLAWARERYACVVFNLHVDHTPAAIARAAEAFRALIDLAILHGGSYYLTYHRWARRDQVETCYPRMREFLAQKLAHDPEERFQSEWYRHYRAMFGEDG